MKKGKKSCLNKQNCEFGHKNMKKLCLFFELIALAAAFFILNGCANSGSNSADFSSIGNMRSLGGMGKYGGGN